MISKILKKQINKIPFIRNLIFEFRKGKIRQIIHYIFNGHLICNLKISRYFKRNNIKKLQIGGGKHIKEGWLNGDILIGRYLL